MVIADDVTGRDFVDNIIAGKAYVNLGDVHSDVREELYRHCDALLNHARDLQRQLEACTAACLRRHNIKSNIPNARSNQ